MSEYKPLSRQEWGKLVNRDQTAFLAKQIQNGELTYQTIEMLKLTNKGDKVLEIGCAEGTTSIYLAMNGRNAIALDFSEECLACAYGIAEELECEIETVLADATKELPFEEDSFDVVFQAGLLEHFEKQQRIDLLKLWGRVGKKMVSIIPNAGSLAYRTGKAIQEANGTWKWGMELPQYSLREEFMEAGYYVHQEYTIGEAHALNFLPKDHYLRQAIERWINENPCEDNCWQGYLLVTIGSKIGCDKEI